MVCTVVSRQTAHQCPPYSRRNGMGESDTGHERVLTYWTLHNAHGGTLSCELSGTERGLVVRCLDEVRNVVLGERVKKAAAAADLAAQWKAQLLEKRDYFERPASTPPNRLDASHLHVKPSGLPRKPPTA